ncbi:autotransporter-associated beta strand repeat protein [Rhodotorula toruloides]|uniref:Autotransporter-associated beta strand repeat protein n=1 Tax=Rhodotorula toruloides TaxID=5286 RepID=A0A511KFT3_RHOTO|nr:autotransporter-associated beta strand repeat protein [Rhodotorula toruloides]
MSTWPAGAFVAPLIPFTVTSSANLAAVTSRLGAALLIALSLVLLTRLVFFPPVRRSQTLTELNTLLNRHENGGTGVVARKWRRRFFAPLRYGDEDELAGSGVEGSEDEVFEWTFTSKPTPNGLRGCLKRVVMETSVEKAVEVVEVEEEGSSSPARRSAKSVRVVEPNLDDIRALRELWASPEMQGPGGLGGIGGYRRTSDFYSKSQGGAAVIKRATDVGPVVVQKMAGPGSASTPTEEDESETVTEDEDDADAARSNPRRPTRVSSLASTTPRSASLSPSPAARRQRTLSPISSLTRSGSPAFVVRAAAKSSPSRRRALSPTLGASPRTSSLSPGPPSDRPVVPKWVKTKSGKLASPAPSKLERGEDADEAETTEEEADDDPEAGATPPPTSLASTLAGIAAVAAAIPPISSDASIAMAPPSSSPASSVLSGGESPQESPTPAPKYTSTRQLKLAVTTSPPLKVRTKPLSPRPKTAPATTSHTKPLASLPAPVSPPPSPSPSPCVKAERRLSLRVQQSLTLKNHNKPASSPVHATLRGAA